VAVGGWVGGCDHAVSSMGSTSSSLIFMEGYKETSY